MLDLIEPSVTKKEKLVAIYYCGEAMGSCEKACIMAGYSPRTARGNAYKIVAREGVQAYIKWLNARNNGKDVAQEVATMEEIQAFWTKVMRNGEEATKNRLKASELLAKVKSEDW